MKKRIICFGDSNTWGYNGTDSSRFNEDIRWTSRLQESLGPHYTIIEEGLNSRTTCLDDPFETGKNGLTYLLPCLETHMPFDLLTVMLGTNDMKTYFNLTAVDIAANMEHLIKTAISFMKERPHLARTQILIISPIHIGKQIAGSEISDIFDKADCPPKAQQLSPLYEAVARKYHCHFLDAAKYAKAGTADSVHLDAAGHTALAAALKGYIEQIKWN